MRFVSRPRRANAFAAVLLAAVLAVIPAVPVAAIPVDSADSVPDHEAELAELAEAGRVLVRFHDLPELSSTAAFGTTQAGDHGGLMAVAVDAINRVDGAAVISEVNSLVPAVVVDLAGDPADAASALRALYDHPAVAAIEADAIFTLSNQEQLDLAEIVTTGSTVNQTNPTWGLDRIDQRHLPLDGRYQVTGNGSGVRAYVVDSGVRGTHQEFTGRLLPGYAVAGVGPADEDCVGHGTHVAGTLGGTVTGVAKSVQIVPVRIFGCSTQVSASALLDGLSWIGATHPAGTPGIVNMSLGGPGMSTVDDAVRTLISRGLTVVTAAGNSGTDACQSSPARVAEVLTVSATDRFDQRPSWANWGSCVDLFAPGASILSASAAGDGLGETRSGTSMASPHVAGVAAMLISLSVATQPSQVRTTILGAATTGVVGNALSANRLLYAQFAAAEPGDVDPPTDTESAPTFTAVTPKRVLDTRGGSRVGSSVRRVQLSGRFGVPSSGVGAVAVNVTGVDPFAEGFVVAWPCGVARPGTSSVNVVPGQAVANGLVVPVSASGELCLWSSTPTHVVVDVSGWFAAGSGFSGVNPGRVLDTRGGSRVGSSVRRVQLSGRFGVPSSGVGAVAVNVTGVESFAEGFVVAWPCGVARPGTSSVNVVPGQAVANGLVVPVSASGELCLWSSTPTHVVVDVSGWFAAGSGFSGVNPGRVLDTRGGSRVGSSVRRVQLSGRFGVPSSGVGAVAVNVTGVDPFAEGFVVAWPCGVARPGTSSVNVVPGQAVANGLVVPVSASGELCLWSSTPTHVVVDVSGWFARP